MSQYCPNCGEELAEAAVVCPECGVEVDSRETQATAWLRVFSYLGSAVMYVFALSSFLPSDEYSAWLVSGLLFFLGATLTLPLVKDYLADEFDVDITTGMSLLISLLTAFGGVLAVPS